MQKARYKKTEERELLDRLTLSLTKGERKILDDKSRELNVPVSRLVLDTCTVLRPETIFFDLKVSKEDLEFMVSIVQTVGAPLALKDLLSLLQKYKSKEITHE